MTDTLMMVAKMREMFGGTVTLVEEMPERVTPVRNDKQCFAAAATYCAELHDWHAARTLRAEADVLFECEQAAVQARRVFHARLDAGRAAGVEFNLDSFAEQYNLGELELETVLYLYFCDLRNATPWPCEHDLADLVITMTPGYTQGQRDALVGIGRADATLLRDGLLETLPARPGMVRLNGVVFAGLAARQAGRWATYPMVALPEVEERAGQWQAALPRVLALADDVDTATLARRFGFAGGHIKNAVRQALLAMASAGRVHLEQVDLIGGAMTEWRCLLASRHVCRISDAA